MHYPSKVALSATLAVLAIAMTAKADEPLLGFLSATDLLPKGGMEVEQQITWRHQKASGYFDLVEGQTEVSFGVTDSLQLSPELIYDWSRAYHNGPDGTTTPAEPYSSDLPSADAHFNQGMFVGAGLEAIWRVVSPYTAPVGVAILAEPIIGPHFYELELKSIFQKNFLDDRLVLLANLTWAPEIRDLPANPYADPGTTAAHPNTNIETDVNLGLGASWRFKENWSVGWEFQNEREINKFAIFSHSQWMGNAYYTGPTIHYGGAHFFATLTWWQQLPNAKNYLDPSMIVHGYDDDVDFEHRRIRVKFGYYF